MKASITILLLLHYGLHAQAGTAPALKFIENKNQWDASIHFRAKVNGGYLMIKENGFNFQFINYHDLHGPGEVLVDESGQTIEDEIAAKNISFTFLNSSKPEITGKGRSLEYYNYFIGNDPSCWGVNAHAYSTISLESLYSGVNMFVYSQGPHAKYDLIVAPGVDPGIIHWKYDGGNSIYLDSHGNLRVTTQLGDIVEQKPYAYQLKDGRKFEVPVEFILDRNVLAYDFPDGYDPCYELIIDPILIFSAYSGSTSDNWGNTATYDAEGNVYSGGIVRASSTTGFPVTTGVVQSQAKGGVWDIGILKYDSSGSRLLYATYLGGSNTETPQSFVVDNDGNLLVLGATGSSDFPVTTSTSFKGGISIDPLGGVSYNQGTDIYIAKLSSNGRSLIASAFFGGTKNDGVNFISGNIGTQNKVESPLGRNYGDQLRGDIIIDNNNNAYIASNTLSDDLPASTNAFNGGSHDAIVAKFNASLELDWSRYIGGTDTDAAYSIKVRGDHLLIGGGTRSLDISGMNGFKIANSGGIDGWIMELAQDGSSVVNGTYLGTNAYDQIYFIDTNENGEVYAFGQTQGIYPIQGNVYQNQGGGQFVHKLSSDLKTSLLSTVIGSGGNTPNISPTAFLVSDCDYLYLSGWGGGVNTTSINTNSGLITRNYVGGNTFNLPTTPDAIQRTTSGSDFYFMVLSSDASEFLYGTYFGGNTSRTHVDGGTSRFDKQGIVYHAVCAGCGGFSDFPARNVPAFHQLNRSGGGCNNAVFKFDLSVLRARLQTNNIERTMPGITRVCIPDAIVFQNLSTGGEIFEWDFGDGVRRVLTDTTCIVYKYKDPGTYTVKLTAIDQGTCKVRDQVSRTIVVDLAQSSVQDDDALCEGDNYTLKAFGGSSYQWFDSEKKAIGSQSVVSVKPAKTLKYNVIITEASGCTRYDSVLLTVVPAINPAFNLRRESNCLIRPYVSIENPQADSTNYTFTFDLGDGTQSDLPSLEHTFNADSTYRVKLIAQREFCVFEESITVDVSTIVIPNIITPGSRDGKNDAFTIQYGEPGRVPADAGLKVNLLIYNRWGDVVFQDEDYRNDWTGSDLAAGVYFYEVTIEGYATCKDWVHLVR